MYSRLSQAEMIEDGYADNMEIGLCNKRLPFTLSMLKKDPHDVMHFCLTG